MRRLDREHRFVGHPNGICGITGLRLTNVAPLGSTAAQSMINRGILSNSVGDKALLEIEFDGKRRRQTADFRPNLRFRFQW
jgi:hypothetical protein